MRLKSYESHARTLKGCRWIVRAFNAHTGLRSGALRVASRISPKLLTHKYNCLLRMLFICLTQTNCSECEHNIYLLQANSQFDRINTGLHYHPLLLSQQQWAVICSLFTGPKLSLFAVHYIKELHSMKLLVYIGPTYYT